MLRRPAKESLFSCHFRQNYGQSVSLVNVIFFPNHFEFVFRRQPPFSRKQIGHFLYFKLFRHRSSFVALFNPFNSGNKSQFKGLSSVRQAFFGKPLPRPGRLAFPSGANHASSCLFAEANRKENVKTLPPKLHIQTVIFQRGDPIANRPTQKCQEQENQKARLSASFFSNFFSPCFDFWGVLHQERQTAPNNSKIARFRGLCSPRGLLLEKVFKKPLGGGVSRWELFFSFRQLTIARRRRLLFDVRKRLQSIGRFR